MSPDLPEGGLEEAPAPEDAEMSPAEMSPAEMSPAALPGIAEEEEGVETGSAIETDRLASAVADILSLRCGTCHDGGRADGGLGQVHDLAQLITAGAIVPGSSATSPLVQVLTDGSMPPVTPHNAPPLSSGEVALVARFVDQLPTTPPAACDALPYVSSDEVYAALLADVQAASPEDRPFLRYAGLTYASNGGSCGPALARQRSALFKMVNSVSSTPEIHVPRAIDADGLLYRIDLRDYGWNHEIDLEDDGSPDFANGWLAIAAAAQPYALELAGTEADELKRFTGAVVPFLPANALVHAATAGDLYYALVGERRTGNATRAQLGVELDLYDADPLPMYAGFSAAGPWSGDRRVTRAEQQARPGRFYWSLEEDTQTSASSIYEDPLTFRSSEPVPFIYNLPNGLQAYGIEGADGALLRSVPLRCDAGDCKETALLNAVACQACHEAGLVPATDWVREIFEKNALLYDNDTAATISATYPGALEFAQLLSDGSQLHLDALQRAGVTLGGPEPISFVYYQFERTALGLRRAAGELGVTPEELRSVITSTSGGLTPLLAADGVIERSALDSAYVATRCALDPGARNRPVACP